ncbi:MAG: hypothetical protein RR585_14430 [Coprobacillus sp.]
MKQFLIDLCLVLLLICVISLFFGDYNVSKTMFQRSINEFEETISNDEPVKEQYVTVQDSSDNHVSSFFKSLSDGCVQVIQYIVLVFSNFVSMILGVMVY